MTTFAIANLSDLNFGGLSGSLIGDVSSVVSGQNLSVTIQPNVVTFAKFQQVAAASLVGNPTGSLANATGITLGATLTFSASVLQTAAGTGDITWAANSFATTIAANAVTFAKFQQIPAVSLVGNSTAGSANAQSVTLGATLAFSGTVVQTGAATGDVTWAANSFATSIAASAVTTAKIANSAVTYAKLQNESANTLLGNANSISGAPFEVALGTTLLMSGNTTLITGAGTGDVTWNPNAFLTTVAKIQGVTVSGVTGTGNVVFSASPTLSGTVTGPDAGTWTSSGLASIKALGIGEAVPAAGIINTSGVHQIAGVTVADNAAWTSYTPTVSASGGSPTTLTTTAFFKQLGKVTIVSVDILMTNIGTATGTILITLPNTVSGHTGYMGTVRENAVSGVMGQAFIGAAATTINIQKYDGTTLWATNNHIFCTIAYENT